MDFTLTDIYGQEKGPLEHCGVNMVLGTDNDFQISLLCIGSYVYGCGFYTKSEDRSGGNLMLEIANVKLSKNTVNAGEKYVISVDINEIIDYPYDFPYDFPVSCTRKAEPEK